jgi:hypothetical protein
MTAKAMMETIGFRIDTGPPVAIRKALLAALRTNSISAVGVGVR